MDDMWCSRCGTKMIYGSSFCLPCGLESALPERPGMKMIVESYERIVTFDGERFSVQGRFVPEVSSSHSHTIDDAIRDDALKRRAADMGAPFMLDEELVKILSPPAYDDEFRVMPSGFVHMDGGTLDIGITRLTDDGDLPDDELDDDTVTEDELAECYRSLEIADEDPDEDVDRGDRRVPTSERGAGRTTLMLMDAAERDRAGLKVVVVMKDQREIRHVLENPIVKGWGLRPSHFIGVESADPILRGYKRSSVFVDHHVWEAGEYNALERLRYLLDCLSD